MIRCANDVIEIAKQRGFMIVIDEGPPIRPILRRPPNVDKSLATKTLLDALKAWRLEIIEELRSHKDIT